MLPDVKEKNFLYIFSGEESWQVNEDHIGNTIFKLRVAYSIFTKY